MEAFGSTDIGCVRTNNEDYYLVAPSINLFLVADGMGGARAGEVASKLAADTLWEMVYKSEGAADIGLLERAFVEANSRVVEAAAEDFGKQGMGTTMTAALATNEEISICHVGDSRFYEFRNGELTSITNDQTWVNEVGRRLGIAEEALRKHPMRHVLTMAIGVTDDVQIQTYTRKTEPDALYMLSSDGLHGVLKNPDMVSVLSESGVLEDKCRRLIDLARAKGGPDNITVVLFRVRPDDSQLRSTMGG